MTEEADRYHLLLSFGGRPAQHGWWARETTARSKFNRWVGSAGTTGQPRVTLTDQETGEVLAVWPDQP
ncbi:hypothetical protein ABZ636_40510 [Streptomyces sp. NPDC007251]|uniref:hypothetical protein n=1 Tax=Streptomyces sp. NPDC007251 TaxID=3154483 RepID=UPI0033C09867